MVVELKEPWSSRDPITSTGTEVGGVQNGSVEDVLNHQVAKSTIV